MNTSGSTLSPHNTSVSPSTASWKQRIMTEPVDAAQSTNATRTVRVGNARVQHSIEGWETIEKIVGYVHAICRVSQVPRATPDCNADGKLRRRSSSSNPLHRSDGSSLADLKDTENGTVVFNSCGTSSTSGSAFDDPSAKPRSLGSAILISIPNMSQMLIGSSDDDDDDDGNNEDGDRKANGGVKKESRGARRRRERTAFEKLRKRKVTLTMSAAQDSTASSGEDGSEDDDDDDEDGESDAMDDDFNAEEMTGVLITTTAVLPQEYATSDKRATFLEQPVEGSAAIWGKATVPISVRIYEEKTFFDSVVLPRSSERESSVPAGATEEEEEVGNGKQALGNNNSTSTEEGRDGAAHTGGSEDVNESILRALKEDPLLNKPPLPPPRRRTREGATEKAKETSENALGFVVAQCDIFDDNCCCPMQHRQNSPYQRKNHFKKHTVSTTLARIRPLPLPLLLTNVPTVSVGDTHLMVTHINAVDRHYIVLKVKAIHDQHCEYELFDPYCDFSSGGPIFTQSGDFVGLQHQVGDVVYGLRITSIVQHLFQTMALGLCRIAIRGGSVTKAVAGKNGVVTHPRRLDSATGEFRVTGGDTSDPGLGGAPIDDLLWHNSSTYRFSQKTAPSLAVSRSARELPSSEDSTSLTTVDVASTTQLNRTVSGAAWRDHSRKLLEMQSASQDLDQKTMLVGVAGDFVIDYEDFHRLRLREGFKKRTVPPTLAVPHFMEVWNEWCRDLRSVLGLMYVFDYQVDIAILALRTLSNHDAFSETNVSGLWNTTGNPSSEQKDASSKRNGLERTHGDDNVKEENVVARVESVIRLGGVQIILELMDLHSSDVELVEAALCVLASVSISRAGKDTLLHEQGVVSILEAMQLHSCASKVQQWGCYTLRNLLSYNHVDASGDPGDQKHGEGLAWENDDEMSRLEGVEQFQLFGGISHILYSLQLNMEHHELQHLVAWGFDLVASAIQQESGDDVELLMCAVEAGALPLIVKAAELYDKEMMVIQGVLALMRTLCCSGILSTTEKVVDIVGAQLTSALEFQQNQTSRSRAASDSVGASAVENQMSMLTTQDLNRILLQPTPRTSHLFDSKDSQNPEGEASSSDSSSSSESDDGWFELGDWVTNITDVLVHPPNRNPRVPQQPQHDAAGKNHAAKHGREPPRADAAGTHLSTATAEKDGTEEHAQASISHASAASNTKSVRSRSYFQSTTDSHEAPSRLNCSTRAASHASPQSQGLQTDVMDEEAQLQVATSGANAVERHIISASCIGALTTSFDVIYWLCGVLYLVEEERRYPRVAQYSMDVLWAVFVYTTLPKSVKKYAKVLGLRRLIERAPTSFPSDDGVARAASCIIHELDRVRRDY